MNVETLLRDTLHDRAELAPAPRTPLARVASAARARRRRGRSVAAAAVLVAAAVVAVPILVAGDDAADGPRPPLASDPTRWASPIPALPYAVGDVLHDGGRQVPLPDDDVAAVTTDVDGSGWRVAADVGDPDDAERPLRITRIDVDGEVLESFCGTGVLVTSPDYSQGAWTETACSGGGPTTIYRSGPPVSGGTATAPADTLLLGIGDDGTLTYLEPGGTVRRIAPDGARGAVAVAGQVMGFDPTTGRIATGTGSDRLTGTMLDPDGSVVWRRPGLSLLAFSPDGRHVLAAGDDPTTAYVLVAETGAVLTSVPAADSLVWEDAEHLVGVEGDEGSRRFVRYDLEDHTTDLGPAPDGEVVWVQ